MNLIDQSFIKEHIDNLLEYRDIDEIKCYLKANNYDIKDKEIEQLKDNIQTLISVDTEKQFLDMEDLYNVSGGDLTDKNGYLTQEAATGIAVAVGLIIGVLACIPVGFAIKGAYFTDAGKALGGFERFMQVASPSVNALMVGSGFFGDTYQLTEGSVNTSQAINYQNQYANEMTERTNDYNNQG